MGNMLGARRLSHGTDESTSIERQGEQLTAAAQMRGDTLVALTEDVDVSGAVSPFERADLGPWLTDPEKISQWDVLAFTKIDRISRSLFDFVALLKWADANGKTLLSVTEGVDFGKPVGRLIGQILAMFAEFERARMKERRADHTAKAVKQARWDGRSIPPGYRPVQRSGHFELELDEAKTARIRAMAGDVIGGMSARQTGPRYGLETSGVLSVLRNPALRGYVVHHGDIVRGEDGLPVTREAVLDDETWAKLQAALDRNAKRNAPAGSGEPGRPWRQGARKGAAMLLGVATCALCGGPLYIGRRAAGDRYRHRDGSKCRGSFTAAHLETALESELLRLLGTVERTLAITVPGKGADLRAQIKRAQESVDDLDKSYENGDVPAAAYGRMQTRLEDKIARLQASLAELSPEERDGCTRQEPTGQTYAQYWAGLDTEGRGRFLRSSGIKVLAARSQDDLFPAMTDTVSTDAGGATVDLPTVVPAGRAFIEISWGTLPARDQIAKSGRVATVVKVAA